jgi:enoyl-CoA hydratase/carnithine racemase
LAKRQNLQVRNQRGVATLEMRLEGGFLGADVQASLADAVEEIRLSDETRVVVLRSRGRDFCVGGDGDGPRDGIAALASVRVPVIASLHGKVLDEGLELALACDFRLAAAGTRLGLTQLSRGVLPSHGGTQRLPRLVGRGQATRMLLLSEVLSARQAVKDGLIHEVHDAARLSRKVAALGRSMAARSPVAQKLAKEALLAAGDLSLAEGLRLEGDLYVLSQSTEDRAEGLAAFREKRRPKFSGN